MNLTAEQMTRYCILILKVARGQTTAMATCRWDMVIANQYDLISFYYTFKTLFFIIL